MRPPRIKNIWKAINTALLVVLLSFIAFIAFFPIDVLEDDSWTIVVEGGDTHKSSDNLSVSSNYIKKRNVTGEATRYLECKNSTGAFIRYPINVAQADRRASTEKRGTGIVLGIPDVVPLPAVCRVTISVKYTIFPGLRYVTEINESPEFNIVKANKENT